MGTEVDNVSVFGLGGKFWSVFWSESLQKIKCESQVATEWVWRFETKVVK